MQDPLSQILELLNQASGDLELSDYKELLEDLESQCDDRLAALESDED